MPGLRLILAASPIASNTGCALFSPAAPHKPVEFQKTWSPPRDPAFPNWPLPPDEALREIDDARKESGVRSDEVAGAGAGTNGAKQAVFYFPDVGQDVAYKIKRVPGDLDGVNNSTRKELAAYAIQSLFLDPEGQIFKVEPGPSLDDDEGALREGDVVQFGLTKKEIDKVWKRIQKLIEQVDDGSLPVF